MRIIFKSDNGTRMRLTPELLRDAQNVILGAESALGQILEHGERIDLLLDNLAEIPGPEEARHLVGKLIGECRIAPSRSETIICGDGGDDR